MVLDSNSNFGEHHSFLWGHFGVRTSGDICLGFQSQGGSLACARYHLYAIDSSDSPLVKHLTSCQPACQSVVSIYKLATYTNLHDQLKLLSSKLCVLKKSMRKIIS